MLGVTVYVYAYVYVKHLYTYEPNMYDMKYCAYYIYYTYYTQLTSYMIHNRIHYIYFISLQLILNLYI